MKIQISFRATVTYAAEVEMPDAEWMSWNHELEANPSGRKYREICQRLFDRHFRLGEPSDYDDPELDDFSEAPPARRTLSAPGKPE